MSNAYQQKPVAPAGDDSVAAKAASAALDAAEKDSRNPKAKKSASAFRTISEVADDLGVQQHVLRFWETKFTQVKPLKRGGGRRYYRPEDVTLLQTIYRLLYTEGYTIKGVQKLLKGQGRQQIIESDLAAPAKPAEAPKAAAPVQASAAAANPAKAGLSDKQRMILEAMLGDLKDLRSMIRGE